MIWRCAHHAMRVIARYGDPCAFPRRFYAAADQRRQRLVILRRRLVRREASSKRASRAAKPPLTVGSPRVCAPSLPTVEVGCEDVAPATPAFEPRARRLFFFPPPPPPPPTRRSAEPPPARPARSLRRGALLLCVAQDEVRHRAGRGHGGEIREHAARVRVERLRHLRRRQRARRRRRRVFFFFVRRVRASSSAPFDAPPSPRAACDCIFLSLFSILPCFSCFSRSCFTCFSALAARFSSCASSAASSRALILACLAVCRSRSRRVM